MTHPQRGANHPVWWLLVGAIILAIIGLYLFIGSAHANPWENASPELQKWFQEQVDENGRGCCDESDGFRTQVSKNNGVYQFFEYGKWWDIPPEKIKFVDLPEELKKFHTEGLSVVFRNFVTGEMYIHCVRMQRPLY